MTGRSDAQAPVEGQARRKTVLARTLPATAIFLLLAMILGIWALSSPPMAGPEEPSHAVRAAGTVRGEPFGTSEPDGSRTFLVPGVFEYAYQLPCFVTDLNATARCAVPAPEDPGPDRRVPGDPGFATPVYYAVVGLPTLVDSSPSVFYLMRGVGALLSAAFLAFALVSALRLGRPLLTAVALLGITPMVLFLGSVIGPSGVGLASAAAVWCGLLLFSEPSRDAASRRATALGLTLSACGLVLFLPLGVLWLVLLVGAVAVLVPSSRTAVREIPRSAAGVVALAAVAASVVVAVTSAVLADVVWNREGAVRFGDLAAFGRSVLFETQQLLVGAVGMLGAGEVRIPGWVYILYLGLIFALLFWGATTGRGRAGLRLCAAVAVALAVPAAARASGLVPSAEGWQGHDYLPAFFVVLVALAATMLAPPRWPEAAQLHPPVWVLPTAWGVLQAAAFAVYLHRHVKGTNGAWHFPMPNEWDPPGGWLFLLGSGLVAMTLLVVVVTYLSARIAGCRPDLDSMPLTVLRPGVTGGDDDA